MKYKLYARHIDYVGETAKARAAMLAVLELETFVPDIHHHYFLAFIHLYNVSPFPFGLCYWLHAAWGREGKSVILTFAAGAAAAGVCVHLLPADAPAQSSPTTPCWSLGYIYIIIYQLVLFRP